MANIVLYAHGGSGNHGCEAIVRSTVDLLEQSKVTLITSNPEEDTKYGLNRICSLIQERTTEIKKADFDFLKAYLALKVKKDWVPLEALHYKNAFSNISKGDIAMSIGGDNYCYLDTYRYTMLHDLAKKRGAKTVLWGCSVEPAVITNPEIAADLAAYDLITVRETISYEAIKKVNSNAVLVCDSAFLLNHCPTSLPDGFIPGNTIGINLSPMAIKNESVPGMAMANYEYLIRWIIENTDQMVALIPHVVWQDTDDRSAMLPLLKAFEDTGRICLVEDRNCEEMKTVISQCSSFIGARTHATIAAYSTCVPTLVVGYSVKARGIARDLFGDETGYVLPVQDLKEPDQLTRAFIALYEKKNEIRQHLTDTMPGYKSQGQKAIDAIMRLVT